MTQIDEIRAKPEKQELLKKMKLAVWVISAAVLGLVVLMREVKIPLPDGMSLSFLPPFHAFLNSLAAFSLVMALIYIKKKNALVHQRWIYSAMICSFVFSFLKYVFCFEICHIFHQFWFLFPLLILCLHQIRIEYDHLLFFQMNLIHLLKHFQILKELLKVNILCMVKSLGFLILSF